MACRFNSSLGFRFCVSMSRSFSKIIVKYISIDDVTQLAKQHARVLNWGIENAIKDS